MRCKYCNSDNLIIRGRNREGIVRMQCKRCQRYPTYLMSEFEKGAKILLLDIETLYMEVRGIWRLKTEYIQPDRIMKDWSILCYAAKWLFEPDIMGEVVTPEEAVGRNERSIIEGVWKLIDEANIVVTQNGINFDMKSLNTKFLKHDLPPPSKYFTVDTKVVATSVFRFPSNKLDYLAKAVLSIEGKTKMDIEDWDNCSDGEDKKLPDVLKKETTRRDFLRGTATAAGSALAITAIGGIAPKKAEAQYSVQGVPGTKPYAQKYRFAERQNCTGCRSCEFACSLFHTGNVRPALSRIYIAKYKDIVDVPVMCRHCDDAPCIKACPTTPNSLTKDAKTNGFVLNTKTCLGAKCMKCAEACPAKYIRGNPDTGQPLICDLCGDS